jgi:hypothetical protein
MSRNDRGVSTSIIIFMVLAVLAVLLAAWAFEQHRAATRPAISGAIRPPLGPEQKAYLPSLVFSELRMSAAANYLGGTVTYLDGSVTNTGAKPVRSLEVELDFVDMMNQVVLRENAHPLAAPLQPGEKRSFQVSFDHMPADWNQAPPRAKAVYLEF